MPALDHEIFFLSPVTVYPSPLSGSAARFCRRFRQKLAFPTFQLIDSAIFDDMFQTVRLNA